MQSGLEKEEERDGEGRKGGNFEEPFFARERQRERDMKTRRDHYFPFHLAAAAVSVSVSRFTSLPSSPVLLLESDSLEGDENVGEEERAEDGQWRFLGRRQGGREGEGDR